MTTPSLATTVQLYSDNGTNFIRLLAPSGLTISQTFIWPSNTGTTGQALTTDGNGNLSWTTISSGVSGPGSSTNNAIVRWNGVGGNTLADSGITIDGSNNVTFAPGTHSIASSGGTFTLGTTDANVVDVRTGGAAAITISPNNSTFWTFGSDNILKFGGTTSSFPAISRSSAALTVRLADNSAFADLQANNIVSNANFTAPAATSVTLLGQQIAASAGSDVVVNTSVNRTAGNLFEVKNNGVSKLVILTNGGLTILGGGTLTVPIAAVSNRITLPQNAGGVSGNLFWTSSAAITSDAVGVIRVWDSTLTTFDRLKLGPDSASFPALVANVGNSSLDVKATDNSAFLLTRALGYTLLSATPTITFRNAGDTTTSATVSTNGTDLTVNAATGNAIFQTTGTTRATLTGTSLDLTVASLTTSGNVLTIKTGATNNFIGFDGTAGTTFYHEFLNRDTTGGTLSLYGGTLGDGASVKLNGSTAGAANEADLMGNTVFFKSAGGTTYGSFNATGLFAVGTSTATSTLHAQGSYQGQFTAVTTNTTLGVTHQFVGASASGGAITVTLPTAVGIAGRTYLVKKTDASVNSVTIATTGGQTIDGAASVTLATQYSARYVVSDGANWLVISTL